PAGIAPSRVPVAVPPLVHWPPLVISCWAYAAPTVAGVRKSVTICRGAPAWPRRSATIHSAVTARTPRAYLVVMTNHSRLAPGLTGTRRSGWRTSGSCRTGLLVHFGFLEIAGFDDGHGVYVD